jgi:thioredoxin reductase
MSQIKQASNIEIIYNSQILEVEGDGEKITGIKIKSTGQQGESTEKDLVIDRLYVEIGGVPGTAMLIPLGVTMDEGGFLQVDDNLSTNVQGIFAAGDVISHKYSIEQISSAVGLGAHAATSVFSYLKQQKAPSLWGTSQIKR